MKINKLKLFIFILLGVFLIVISLASYLAIQLVQINKLAPPVSNFTSQTLSCPTNVPVISFEIDDLALSTNDGGTMENALYLTKKYNVTFDLGVIAYSFQENVDPDVFSTYQNNQDVFEIIAHGYTHGLDQLIIDSSPVGSYGEFYIFYKNQTTGGGGGEGNISSNLSGLHVPYDFQDFHIRRMYDIFKNYNLTTALQIFTPPYHTGDFNTTLLAEKYGYKLIIQKITSPQRFSEIKFGKIIDTQTYIDIPLTNNLTSKDVINYISLIRRAISMGQSRIDVSFHSINFQYLSNIDSFINQIKNANYDVNYGFLSDRFNC